MNRQLNASIYKQIPRLWKYVSFRRRIQLSLLLLLMIVASVAELISIGAVLPFLGVLTSPQRVFTYPVAQPLIEFMKFTEPSQLLVPLTILFGFSAVLSGGLRLLLSWAQTRLSYAMGADLSAAIYRNTLYQPYAVHLMRNTSEIIAGVTTKADGIVHHIILPTLVIISSGAMMATVLLALLAIQPVVTSIAIGSFGGIYVLVIFITRSRLAADSSLISHQQTRVIKALQEALGGFRDVLIDGTQDIYYRIYRDADWKLRRAQSNIAIVASSPRFIVEALGMALISFMAYLLSKEAGGLESAIPVIGTLALAAQRMLPLLQQSYASWSNIRGGQAGLSDTLYFLEQSIPKDASNPKAKPIKFLNEIELDNLWFRYSDDHPWIFKGLNLKIPKFSRIGFIGSTGSGKSTMLDIIMGLLAASKGALNIDGEAINVNNYRAWQTHIAHVPQSIFLADASIAENIAFGVPLDQIDHKRITQAAQSAQIASTIESWVDGYETMVGERGIRLSGGQRQRIGIARALYKNADVIILDEATSALDSSTELDVMESINSLGNNLTILIVAHRLSTLRNCTQIVELENGLVKRFGTYSEMIGFDNQRVML